MIVKDITRLVELEQGFGESYKFHNILGKNRKMQEVYSLIGDLSNVDATVLITGESGTGKELVAEALHYGGKRNKNPLIKVNCSALPEGLIESELFGHVKGAFTGAIQDKTGRFQKANGGTIFLDEIGDISPGTQVRLLRVLQEKEIERVGESTVIKVDVRVITATNQDLKKNIDLGRLREDLYYRLNVVELELPPLRDRSDDIPLFVKHFLGKFNKKNNKNIKEVSDNVMQIFLHYPWPGNIRELENVIEHAVITTHQSVITVDDLPERVKENYETDARFSEKKKYNECEAIIKALEKCRWNQSKAARLLGIHRKTLYNKIKKYTISKS
jgi:transcriptional regulator with PAS, ATPase and Fis domain